MCKTGSKISDEHHDNSLTIAAISTETDIAALVSRKKGQIFLKGLFLNI